MKRSERAAQARTALDRRFAASDPAGLRTRPAVGWMRAVRGALGMSQADLARRLGVSPPAVTDLERREREDAITIGKLAEVARAMDCTFVYAFVPNSTLEDTVQREARRRAVESAAYVGRTMGLEAQGLDAERAGELVDRETRRVIEEHRVWHDR